MIFQGTSTPSIPPSIQPARISSQPSRPETSSSPPKSATAAPDGNVESRLPFFSSTPTVLASAPRCDRSLRRASGGSLGTYLTVPPSRSIGRTPRSCSCGTRARSCVYTHKRRFDQGRLDAGYISSLSLGETGETDQREFLRWFGSEIRKSFQFCPALWFKG